MNACSSKPYLKRSTHGKKCDCVREVSKQSSFVDVCLAGLLGSQRFYAHAWIRPVIIGNRLRESVWWGRGEAETDVLHGNKNSLDYSLVESLSLLS